MTYFEKINEMKNAIEFDFDSAKEQYLEAEANMVSLFGDYIKGAEVSCKTYGTGKVVNTSGTTIETMVTDIDFNGEIKKFLFSTIMNNKFVKFADILEIGDAWDSVYTLHTDLTRQLKDLEYSKKQMLAEAAKKAEAEKKAEAKYKKQKEKAIKDFEELTQQAKASLSTTEEFYYALGWLAKHVGSMTAVLPDYLGAAFEKHFGADTPKTLVDSRAKTSGGYAKQWSWEFKCGIKKLKDTVVPACIENVTTDFSKGIHNTAFIWDLVYNYGFQFGKKQDVEKIKQAIPSQYISSFEAGLSA